LCVLLVVFLHRAFNKTYNLIPLLQLLHLNFINYLVISLILFFFLVLRFLLLLLLLLLLILLILLLLCLLRALLQPWYIGYMGNLSYVGLLTIELKLLYNYISYTIVLLGILLSMLSTIWFANFNSRRVRYKRLCDLIV
jgi:hypothetical protein